MINPEIEYTPIEGKTYSLFGENETTVQYYNIIENLCDKLLKKGSIPTLLETIQSFSSKRQQLRKQRLGSGDTLISYCLKEISPYLKVFTKKTADHLATLSAMKYLTDRRLGTTEEQYHLYMIEIALTNRLNLNSFRSADRKISLQPYCLQDFTTSCKASKSDFDYQCKHCSKECFQNRVSRLLTENGIESYIWMGTGLKKTAQEAYKNNQSFAILGIACIPELVWGMRKCRRLNIPVVGLPLNANRCVRWFGEFKSNSVDLAELEKLVKGS